MLVLFRFNYYFWIWPMFLGPAKCSAPSPCGSAFVYLTPLATELNTQVYTDLVYINCSDLTAWWGVFWASWSLIHPLCTAHTYGLLCAVWLIIYY